MPPVGPEEQGNGTPLLTLPWGWRLQDVLLSVPGQNRLRPPNHSCCRSKPQPAPAASHMGDRAIPTPCPVQIPAPQVIESQNGLDWLFKAYLVPTTLPWARTPSIRPGHITVRQLCLVGAIQEIFIQAVLTHSS